MSAKKFIGFGLLLSLLLLFSFSVTARTAIAANESSDNRKETFHKADHSFHKNMLQPQVMQVTVMPEHSAKPLAVAYSTLYCSESINLSLQPTRQANVFIQDVNRCESVSRLLFPFHYFW
ncbi:hypothetical protein L1S35_06445 [Flavobacterium sp. AS60]|uniref:hypothetical protein n=1 Tax=Flavobacterium anseongense TaxID=2910677 RepID=UPI001F48E555|nr:hypothetical protein [Flavobacterium sp. AS60]MCF6129306.1 hypothetical protein [Flavobacterium sp. AS60]